VISEIRSRLGRVIYDVRTDDGGSLAETAVHTLRDKGWTIATAESLTGGLIASTMVEVPGASNVVKGGWVTYQTVSKTMLLGVPEETIARCNVVSEEVACAMAKSAREQLDVDIAVSATGLAGPDGGTPERPVGTVFLGIATRERVYAVPLHLSGNRARIRTLTVKHALHAVTREIKGEMEG
jgi:PncC family amidohydrolase